MPAPPSARVRELETLLATIRHARNILLNIDMWEQHGSSSASDDERARMAAESAAAIRQQDHAKGALDTLVATTREECPGEIAAWVAAHDAYLAAFLADLDAAGQADTTAAMVASDERTAWTEVASGKRAVVDENGFYVTSNDDRYRRLFGIDPNTLAPC